MNVTCKCNSPEPALAPTPGQILIIGTDYMAGPFNDSVDAELWIASHQVSKEWIMVQVVRLSLPFPGA
jgi:hypothetical protein